MDCMVKIFIASFNRASNGAIEHLVTKLKDHDMLINNYDNADYIMAVGDRTETFDFVLKRYKENKKIIHLWAGEISCWSTHDDVYRHAMTLMSCLQLCTNPTAKLRVESLCNSVDKKSNAHVIGNIMLDDLSTDESIVPKYPYILILYNPITMSTKNEVENEISEISNKINLYKDKYSIKNYIWIEPNNDKYSDLIKNFITHNNLPRKQFLGLLKNCKFFFTNSSCQYYEAPFFLNKPQIISIGKRNTERESKYSNMSIDGAADKAMKILINL